MARELYCTTLTVQRGTTRLNAARITWETPAGLYDIDVYETGEFLRVYPVKSSAAIVNKMERYFQQLRPLMETAAFHGQSEIGRAAYWELRQAVNAINAN